MHDFAGNSLEVNSAISKSWRKTLDFSSKTAFFGPILRAFCPVFGPISPKKGPTQALASARVGYQSSSTGLGEGSTSRELENESAGMNP